MASASDISETANLADSLLLDLDDVRQRVDQMLAVLLQMEEDRMDEEEENLVAGR